MELTHSMHLSNGSQMLLEPMATLLLDSLVKALVVQAQAVDRTPQLTLPLSQISSSPLLLGSPRMWTLRFNNNAQLACRTNLHPIHQQMEVVDQDQLCYHHSTQLTTQLLQTAKWAQMVPQLFVLTIPLATLCPFLSTKSTNSDPTSHKKASVVEFLRLNRIAQLDPTPAAQAAQLVQVTIQLVLLQAIIHPVATQLVGQPIQPLNACNKVFTMLWPQLEMLISMVSYSSTPTSNKNSWMLANNS